MGTPQEDEIHRKLVRGYQSFIEGTREGRELSEKCRRYYNGRQWTTAEVEALKRRNQAPIVINRIQPKVNHIRGREIRNRVDPVTFPRTPKHDDDANPATDALRYITDKEKYDRKRSRVTDEVLVEGSSGFWFHVEQRQRMKPIATGKIEAPGETREATVGQILTENLIHIRHVPYYQMYWDPCSREADFSDAQFLGTAIYYEYADAVNKFGIDENAIAILEQTKSATHSRNDDANADRPAFWDQERKRVKICECSYLEGGEWHVCLFTGAGLLRKPVVVPYRTEDGGSWCPAMYVSGYVDDTAEDGSAPIRYGVVRTMLGPQDEINHRRSKALHLLSTRQLIAEDNAFKNAQQARQEFAKPDGFIEVQDGALSEQRFVIERTTELAAGQTSLMAEAKAEIDQIGPHSAMGAGATSGREYIARDEAGAMELEPLFDNIRDLDLRVYRGVWYLIRQYKTEEWWARVRDDEEKNGFRFVGLNRNMTAGQRMAEMYEKGMPVEKAAVIALGDDAMPAIQQAAAIVQQQIAALQQQGAQIDPKMVEQQLLQLLANTPHAQKPFKSNDVAKLDIDIVLGSAPESAVLQHEEFEALAQMAAQGLPIPPEVIIKASNLRSKRELLQSLQQAKQPDPQQVQMQQMLAQLQLQQQQMALQLQQLQAQRLQADTAKLAAQAAKTQAEAQLGVPSEAQENQANAARLAAEAAKLPGPIPGLGGMQ